LLYNNLIGIIDNGLPTNGLINAKNSQKLDKLLMGLSTIFK